MRRTWPLFRRPSLSLSLSHLPHSLLFRLSFSLSERASYSWKDRPSDRPTIRPTEQPSSQASGGDRRPKHCFPRSLGTSLSPLRVKARSITATTICAPPTDDAALRARPRPCPPRPPTTAPAGYKRRSAAPRALNRRQKPRAATANASNSSDLRGSTASIDKVSAAATEERRPRGDLTPSLPPAKREHVCLLPSDHPPHRPPSIRCLPIWMLLDVFICPPSIHHI